MGPFQLPPAIRPSGKHRMGYKAGSARGSAGKRKGSQSSQSGQGLRKATGLERGYPPILQVSKLRLERGRHLLQSYRPKCQDLPASGTCGYPAGGAARTSRQPLSTRLQAHSHGQGQPHRMIVRGSGTGFLSIQTHWGSPSICLQAEVTQTDLQVPPWGVTWEGAQGSCWLHWPNNLQPQTGPVAPHPPAQPPAACHRPASHSPPDHTAGT